MADEKITWYSQTSKNTISDTDTVMVYDGQKTYTVPFSAIKSALPSSGGSSGGSSSGGSVSNWYDTTQKLEPNNTDLFPVYDGTDTFLVPISSIKGVDNVTDNYVLLTGKDGKQYRLMVDYLGNLYAIKDEAYTANAPAETDNINDVYQALIVNQMWGGGDALTGTAVSHSFIELYKHLNLNTLSTILVKSQSNFNLSL